MSVSVSLEGLFAIRQGRSLWPEELQGIVAKLEDDATARVQWLALADWMQENGEPGLERACRWIARRDWITPRVNGNGQWVFENVPASINGYYVSGDTGTLMGAVGNLAEKLRKHDADGA